MRFRTWVVKMSCVAFLLAAVPGHADPARAKDKETDKTKPIDADKKPRRPEKPVLTITSEGAYFLDDHEIHPGRLEDEIRAAVAKAPCHTLLLRGYKQAVDRNAPDLVDLARRAGANVVMLPEPAEPWGIERDDARRAGAPGKVREFESAMLRAVNLARLRVAGSCFTALLREKPDVVGVIVVGWTVDGESVGWTAIEASIGVPEVDACAAKIVRTSDFPRPPDGKPRVVRFSFKRGLRLGPADWPVDHGKTGRTG